MPLYCLYRKILHESVQRVIKTEAGEDPPSPYFFMLAQAATTYSTP